MDRRQRKTRNLIFEAFIELLSEKSYNSMTVSDIIERADIGRATFYAHFETKDFLLKELCEELFGHIFESGSGIASGRYIFQCDAPNSVFLHLFQHLQKNDNNIMLLTSQNNELFLHYFKANLNELIKRQLSLFEPRRAKEIPEDLWIAHIASTFVETVRWWMDRRMKESPETITKYFFELV